MLTVKCSKDILNSLQVVKFSCVKIRVINCVALLKNKLYEPGKKDRA